MKASEMISKVNRKQLGSEEVELLDKLVCISTMEKNIYSQIIKETYDHTIDLVSGQDLYDLKDAGFQFEDILQLKINGTEYKPGSVFAQADQTYFKKNGKLCIAPKPTQDAAAGIVILYRWEPPSYTEEDYEERDLILPDKFHDAYEHYLRSMICMENKQAAEASAWGAMYNNIIGDLTSYYANAQKSNFKNTNWK